MGWFSESPPVLDSEITSVYGVAFAVSVAFSSWSAVSTGSLATSTGSEFKGSISAAGSDSIVTGFDST